jgi:hypothetical protein
MWEYWRIWLHFLRQYYANKHSVALMFLNIQNLHFVWVLRRTFGLKRDEVTGEWRKLHNEGLNHMYCSPTIVGVIKLRKIRWVGHVACIGEGSVQGFDSEI